MKKIILITLACLIPTVAILFLLVRASNADNYKKNSFTRKWVPNFLNDMPIYQIKNNRQLEKAYSIQKEKYIFHSNDPRRIFITDTSLVEKDTVSIPLKLPALALLGYDLFVDSSDITLISRNLSTVFFYKFASKKLSAKKLNVPLITKSTRISSETIAVRAFDSTRQKQLFQKISLASGKVLNQIELFDTRNDAGFSTDGELLYDSTLHCLLYVQYYQNNFYCLDTNLHLIYKAQTIDTTQMGTVKAKKILNSDKNGNIMPATPQKFINIRNLTYNGKLFVVSTLKSDNEKNEDFIKNSTIDIYSIHNGTYLGSFLLPSVNNEKPISIRVFNNRVVAIYKSNIAIFPLNIHNLKQ